MTTGIEAGILDALLYHLSTYTTTLDIAWPNVDYTPNGENYLEVQVVPNTVVQVSLGDNGYNRHNGLMQITVVWKQGEGVIAPGEIASAISAHFKRGTAINRNSLVVRTFPPRTASAMPDGAGVRLPVIVPWFCDTPQPA